MYDQKRFLGTDETQWPHRIMAGRQIGSVETKPDSLQIRVQRVHETDLNGSANPSDEELLDVDLIVAATGYQRRAHIDMLKDTWTMLPTTISEKAYNKAVAGWNVETEQGQRKLAVGRDYRVQFNPGAVAEDSGIWLQGCCEGTHGVSSNIYHLKSHHKN